jgi:hypothetical protein
MSADADEVPDNRHRRKQRTTRSYYSQWHSRFAGSSYGGCRDFRNQTI